MVADTDCMSCGSSEWLDKKFLDLNWASSASLDKR